MKILKTAINEIATISSDNETLSHPLSDVLDFNEIRAIMEMYETMYPEYKNLRFVEKSEYTRAVGSRYGVTREWYDLVGDYKSKLIESLD
jgi:hypothetical protein